MHLVTPSPWPLVTAMAALSLTISAVSYFQRIQAGGINLFLSLIAVICLMAIWWRDVLREAIFEGANSIIVQRGLRIGVALFILSEIMFFFGFFWAFFYVSLAPAIDIGSIWPPKGIATFSTWGIPFVNTIFLLASGATITFAHHNLLSGNKEEVHYGFFGTIMLALTFLICQLYEYITSPFSINNSVYGATFFMLTGFHGFHVLIGLTFIIINWIRFSHDHFSRSHHVGFEAAAWYWHFVDVVWLFLFLSIYWLGNR